MDKKIGIRIIKTENINWLELEFIQQDNFKELLPEARQALKASIIADDFIQPFYIWEDETTKRYCLDGKHRVLLLQELVNEGYNVPYLLPATFIDCKDKKHAAKLVLKFSSAYAKTTQTGVYNFITLNDLNWTELKGEVDLPEFSVERFEQKFDVFSVKDTAYDEDVNFGVDELELVVNNGDLFQLGNHRLLCGSFTEPNNVKLLMQDTKARIVFCDPPYNLPANFFTNKDEKRHKDFAMAAGEMNDDEFMLFLASIMQTSIDNTVDGAIHYICMDFRHSWHITEAARRKYGSPIPKQECVWVKDIMANGSFYRAKQELIFIFQSENAQHLWNNDLLDEGGFYKNDSERIFIFKNGDAAKHLSHLELQNRIRSNVWNYPSATSTANPDRYELKNHPTPKPVAMIADAILDTTNEGDSVIDWFLGSGTTLIAAEKTNRVCYATEIEPNYVQHIINRYYNYCSKTGREFSFKHINGNLTIEQILKTKVVA